MGGGTVGLWGRIDNRPAEQIDAAPDQQEAEALLLEYYLAFGPRIGKLWTGGETDEPEEDS